MNSNTKNIYAFPVSNDASNNEEQGMTLRDYFAAKALPMAWESEHHKPTFGSEPLYLGVACRAYLIADAMLKERNK